MDGGLLSLYLVCEKGWGVGVGGGLGPKNLCTKNGLTIFSRSEISFFPTMVTRLATGIRQVRPDQMEPGPTASNTGRSRFLLSSACDGGGYYRVARGTGLIPNETQFPCRTLVACLMVTFVFAGRPRLTCSASFTWSDVGAGSPPRPSRRTARGCGQ